MESFGVGDGFNGTGYVVIVPDNIAGKLPVYHMSLAVQTEKETTPQDAENLVNLLYETYSYEGIRHLQYQREHTGFVSVCIYHSGIFPVLCGSYLCLCSAAGAGSSSVK